MGVLVKDPLSWAHTMENIFWKQLFQLNLFEAFCVLAPSVCGVWYISVMTNLRARAILMNKHMRDKEMNFAFGLLWQFLRMLETTNGRKHWIHPI